MIIPFEDLVNSIPKELRTPEIIKGVKEKYDIEVEILNTYMNKAKQPVGSLQEFQKAGSQLIAEFWVNDIDIPKENAYNFHGQNTSQWLYAGCILIDNNQVSTHH
jgi:phosphopantetheine adenylyltransferase